VWKEALIEAEDEERYVKACITIYKIMINEKCVSCWTNGAYNIEYPADLPRRFYYLAFPLHVCSHFNLTAKPRFKN